MKISELREDLGNDSTLIAVSKTFGVDRIRSVYQLGQRDFGENRVQEFLEKFENCQDLSIRWHLIGHLQSNKVKKVLGKVFLFHALDSLKLYKKILQESLKSGEGMACLLQINVSREEQKSGILLEDVQDLLEFIGGIATPTCPILGLMCIGSSLQSVGESKVRQEFSTMRELFEKLREKPVSQNVRMEYLSMGMSGDYPLALECGSNMVRIGRAIFSDRG